MSAVQNPCHNLSVGVFCSLITAIFSMFFVAASAYCSPLTVFVSIEPQKYLLDRIGGSAVATTVLVPRGTDPHDFNPRPSSINALNRADIYFSIGLPFEKGVLRNIRPKIVDLSKGVAPLAEDPHLWLSPPNAIKMAALIGEALAKDDPEHATFFRQNTQHLQEELQTTHISLTKRLAPYHGKSFYVYHPGFGHFAQTYRLIQVAVEVGGKKPSPRRLASLISRAREQHVQTIFTQPEFAGLGANALARAIGAKVVSIDPLAYDLLQNSRIIANHLQQSFEEQP